MWCSVHLFYIYICYLIESRYYPSSPRNRILEAIMNREDPVEIVSACLYSIFGHDLPIPYPSKKRKGGVEVHNAALSSKRSFHVPSPSTSGEPSVNTMKPSKVNINLFPYFCAELFRHGQIKWRCCSSHCQILVMNDYDSLSGNIKVIFNKFMIYYCILLCFMDC